MIIRGVGPEDAAEWLAMRRELWPDGDDHDVEIAAFFAGSLEEPEAVLVAEDDGLLIGVAELSLRQDVVGLEGKVTGYVEGLFVSACVSWARCCFAIIEGFAGVGSWVRMHCVCQ